MESEIGVNLSSNYDYFVSLQNATTIFDDSADKSLILQVLWVALSVIGLLSFIGSLAVVIVIVVDKQMRCSTNTIIASLAIVDLLFDVVCLPFIVAAYATEMWHFGNAWCKVR